MTISVLGRAENAAVTLVTHLGAPASQAATSTAVSAIHNTAVRLLHDLQIKKRFVASTIHMIARELHRQADVGLKDAKSTMESPLLFLTAEMVYHQLAMQKHDKLAIAGIAESLKQLTSPTSDAVS